MLKTSTSFNKICADKKMSKFAHFSWLFNCILDNMFGKFYHNSNLKLKKYKYSIQNINEYFSYNNLIETPSRISCDLFWNESLLKINKEKIKIIEIGCGSGKYADYLIKKFPNKIESYVGIDINTNKEWDNLKSKYDNVNFIVDTYENVSDYLCNVDLIITQSAIEHFEFDLLFFSKINEFLTSANKKILQIHLFPSSPCLYLYFWHGYRQYTPRKVSKIANLNNNLDYTLYELGGPLLNKIHFKFVTLQKLMNRIQLRFKKNDVYRENLVRAFLDNNNEIITNRPSFYALIIN